KAKRLERKCFNATARIENAFDASCLAEALATFYARTRNWQRALEAWTIAPRDEPLSRNAAVGRAEVFIAGAIDALNEELNTAATLKKNPPSDLTLRLPGIEDK